MEEVYYLSIKKAAEKTGLAEFYIRNGVRDGSIPAIKCGGKYMINMEAFKKKLKELEKREDED